MRTDNKTMANTSESRDDELSRDKYHSKRHHLDREKHTKGHHHEDEDRDSKIHNKRKEYHRHELESNKRGDSKSSRANDDFDRNERRKQINERHRDRGGDDEGDISRGDMRTEKKIRDSAEHSNRRDSSGRSGHKESSKRRGEERENDHRKQSVKREIRDEDDGRNAKENLVWGKMEEKNEETKPVEKEKPSFEPSGKLAEDTNTYKGVVIKYNEPPDAHKPKLRWRLYPFKGDEALPVLYIHRQSAYLIGRDRRVADFAVDHPSCSKQHAVFQYRLVPVELDDGSRIRRIKPYIIDLNSANGTYLNNERIEPQRFVELREKDVLKFGFSTREFVLLNEKSNESDSESDHNDMKIPKHSPPSSPSP
ncbi:unnamed protein product [Anisakis simplex]|uniref:Smad nuclear-interacting protein 1 (inferred by orthology to a human protein) n=1 Tax=Anisakis simplex TaxID=6269 RepID=A0A0M3K1K3_ANISI|nr:unnamed protein product [Anisakis simplex]